MKSNIFYVFLIGFSTVVGGLINYLYHPLMLRFLNLSEFAEFESLVSIFNILSVLTTGFVLFLVKEISKSPDDISRVKTIFLKTNKILLGAGISLYILFLICIPYIKSFLHLQHGFYLALSGLIIIFTFQGTVINAVLQGTKKFNFMSGIGVVGSIFKLIFGLIFVYMGYKVLGAILGFVFSGLFILLVSFGYVLYLFKGVKTVELDIKADFLKEKKDIFHYILLVIILSVFMNFDILLAKNIFEPNLAGIYSGLSVIAKFVIFVGSSVETVYFPQIMHYDRTNLPRHFLYNSVLMLFLMSVFAIVVNYFFGGFFLNLLKTGFAGYNNIFVLIIVFCCLYTFIAFFSKILIGRKLYYVNYILLFFMIMLFLIVYSFGIKGLNFYIYTYIVVYLLLAVILFFLINKRK